MLSIFAPNKKKVGFIDQLINGLVKSLIQSGQLLLKTVAGVVFLASILIAVTWHNLRESYDYHIQRGVDAAVSQARLLSYELNTELRLVDNALATIAHEFQETGSSTREFENAIVNQRALLPFSKSVRVADEAGMVRLGNLCISPQRMCLHMRAGCGSIPAHAAIRSRLEPFHQENTQTRIP